MATSNLTNLRITPGSAEPSRAPRDIETQMSEVHDTIFKRQWERDHFECFLKSTKSKIAWEKKQTMWDHDELAKLDEQLHAHEKNLTSVSREIQPVMRKYIALCNEASAAYSKIRKSLAIVEFKNNHPMLWEEVRALEEKRVGLHYYVMNGDATPSMTTELGEVNAALKQAVHAIKQIASNAFQDKARELQGMEMDDKAKQLLDFKEHHAMLRLAIAVVDRQTQDVDELLLKQPGAPPIDQRLRADKEVLRLKNKLQDLMYTFAQNLTEQLDDIDREQPPKLKEQIVELKMEYKMYDGYIEDLDRAIDAINKEKLERQDPTEMHEVAMTEKEIQEVVDEEAEKMRMNAEHKDECRIVDEECEALSAAGWRWELEDLEFPEDELSEEESEYDPEPGDYDPDKDPGQGDVEAESDEEAQKQLCGVKRGVDDGEETEGEEEEEGRVTKRARFA